ncbi:MAG: alpha-amylase [Chlorobi bacterium]|nr:alpha-amylase [Chlorobiota bacterium]
MKPIIYQVLPRLFGNTKGKNIKNGTIYDNGCGKFRYFTDKALKGIKQLGITHIWYTGVIEHATQTDYSEYGIVKDFPEVVKGKAGSPYAIKDYYDVDPDLAESVSGRMKEFEGLVERTHNAGMKVIIDFVPNHLARQYVSDASPDGVDDFGSNDDISVAFARDNNFYYLLNTEFRSPVSPEGNRKWVEKPARVTGNDCLSAEPGLNDWYETVKLNYGINLFDNRKGHFSPVPDTWNRMKNILMFWAGKSIDGFRCDMAEMVPLEFWRWVIPQVKKTFPDVVFVGEVYNPDLYRPFIKAGFDWLYDKVGFYDILRDVITGKRAASDITGALEKISDIKDHMLFFLENHDEQRIASDFFAADAQKGLAGTVLAATVYKNPFMLYFGQETGERGMDEEGFSGRDGRTTIFDYWKVSSVDAWVNEHRFDGGKLIPEQKELREQYQKLLILAKNDEVLNSKGFYDLMWYNSDNPEFDSSRQYACLRFSGSECYLVVVNFSDEEKSLRLRIPEHAFEVTNMGTKGYFKGKDILKGKTKVQFPSAVAVNGGLGMRMDAKTGVIIPLCNTN